MIQFQVGDMTCGHCAAAITKAVKTVDANAQVQIDLAAHKVSVESARSAAEFSTAIADAGYSPQLSASAVCLGEAPGSLRQDSGLPSKPLIC